MKKNILLVLVLISLFLVSGCGKKNETINLSDALKFKNEYELLNGTRREKDGKIIRTISISEDNPIIYKTAEDINEMIDNKETFAVYFGFSDCPWCRSMLPTLLEVAKDLNIDKIYYVDVYDIRDTLSVGEDGKIVTIKDGSSDYYGLLDRLSTVLNDYSLKDDDGNDVKTNEKRIYAPNVVSVVKGKPNLMTSGLSDKQDDAYMELTDDMKKEMYSNLKCVIKCLEKQVCSVKSC